MRTGDCAKCAGNGAITYPGPSIRVCPACDGRGRPADPPEPPPPPIILDPAIRRALDAVRDERRGGAQP